MAHTKAKSAAKNNRESEAKRLGVKLFDGEKVSVGEIIIRQRGTKFHPGAGVRRGNDDTLYASVSGVVKFNSRRKVAFNGQRKSIKTVSVVS
jgi:large subunit ribosomal protein L27